MDEIEDIVSTAAFVSEWTRRAAERRHGCAKWSVIGAHNMLQGAMVVVLSDSDGTGALEQGSRAATREWLLKDRGPPFAHSKTSARFPKERLADLNELLGRVVGGSHTGGFGPREPLRLGEEQLADLDRLHKARNKFVRFTPKTWVVDGTYLGPLVIAACDVTRALMDEPHVLVRLQDGQLKRLKTALAVARSAASDWTRIAPR